VNIGYNETIKLKLFAFADTVNLVVAMASLAPLGQPIPDQVYADLAAAKLALQEYARLNGFYQLNHQMNVGSSTFARKVASIKLQARLQLCMTQDSVKTPVQ
jgi:hypothetical protein